MDNNTREALRWLKQAEYTLDSAKFNLSGQRYAETCFFGQQSAEMAVKAYLYKQGRRGIQLHSVQALLKECSSYNDDFLDLMDRGRKLDRFYTTSRYPDAVIDVLPYETFSSSDATEAIQACEHILDFVRGRI